MASKKFAYFYLWKPLKKVSGYATALYASSPIPSFSMQKKQEVFQHVTLKAGNEPGDEARTLYIEKRQLMGTQHRMSTLYDSIISYTVQPQLSELWSLTKVQVRVQMTATCLMCTCTVELLFAMVVLAMVVSAQEGHMKVIFIKDSSN